MILSFNNGFHGFIELCGNSKGAFSLFMLFRKLIENLINNEFENLVVESYYETTWKYAIKLSMLNCYKLFMFYPWVVKLVVTQPSWETPTIIGVSQREMFSVHLLIRTFFQSPKTTRNCEFIIIRKTFRWF